MTVVSKDGQQFFDIDPDFDTQTGVDKSLSAAQAKGYTAYQDVTKDGQQTYRIPATHDSLSAAFQKGYQTVDQVKNVPFGGLKAKYNIPDALSDEQGQALTSADKAITKNNVTDPKAKKDVLAYANTYGRHDLEGEINNTTANWAANLPQFLNKKMSSPQARPAIDQVQEDADSSRSGDGRIFGTIGYATNPLNDILPIAPAANAGRFARAGVQAIKGAANGSLSGLTNSKEGHEAEGTGLGGAIGAVFSPIISSIAKRFTPEALQKSANSNAYYSMNATPNQQLDLGLPGVQATGKEMIDQGIMKAGNTGSEVASDLKGAMQQTGQKLTNAYQAADSRVTSPKVELPSGEDVALSIQPTIDRLKRTGGQDAMVNALQGFQDSLRQAYGRGPQLAQRISQLHDRITQLQNYPASTEIKPLLDNAMRSAILELKQAVQEYGEMTPERKVGHVSLQDLWDQAIEQSKKAFSSVQDDTMRGDAQKVASQSLRGLLADRAQPLVPDHPLPPLNKTYSNLAQAAPSADRAEMGIGQSTLSPMPMQAIKNAIAHFYRPTAASAQNWAANSSGSPFVWLSKLAEMGFPPEQIAQKAITMGAPPELVKTIQGMVP